MIGIISDIHGNHVALMAVLDCLNEMSISEVVCLGDVGGYYCQVNECCQTLRAHHIFSIMGNHDWYLATGESCPRSNSANFCLNYQRQVLTSDNLRWIKARPLEAYRYGVRMIHGGWNDPLDEYLKPSIEYFAGISGKNFSSGHTHVQCICLGNGKAYCNPGSVGQPRDGDPRAAFATWDGSQFALHRVEYDIQFMEDCMKTAGFDPYYYRNLSRGLRIGA